MIFKDNCYICYLKFLINKLKIMRKQLLYLISFSAVVLFSFPVSAQQINPCGTNEMLEIEIEKHPEIKDLRNNFEKNLENYLANKQYAKQGGNAQKRIIPVIFHVIHEGGAENISKAQILDQLRILNEDLNRKNPDTVNTPAPFAAVAANCNIEFRLATIDPNGECTDGINRVYSALTAEARNNVKALSYWNSQNYFNIWVVKSIEHTSNIGGITLGYAQFPQGGLMSTDGIVLRHDYVGSIEAASQQVGRTATHEVGHWLGLRHIWGDDECGSDNIFDTPIHKEANFNVCSFPYFQTKPNGDPFCVDADTVNGEMFMNYMDYSDDNCMNMFTEGQKMVMDYVLGGDSTVFGFRSHLVSEENLIATGVNDAAITSSCTPRVAFTARPIGGFGPKTLICEGESVNYVDFSFNYSGPITREWTFAGGTPATSNDSTPAVVYSTPGVHDVTLKITIVNGDVSLTKSKYIVVDPTNAPNAANFYSFGFEDANSFNNDWVIQNIGEDANNQWSFDVMQTPTWALSSNAVEGNSSVKMDVYNSTDIGEDALITPPLDLSGINNVQIKFKHAGAGVSTNAVNALNVWWSICGTGYWYLINPNSQTYSISPEQTAHSGLYDSDFKPTDEDWMEDSLFTSANISKSNVRFKFEYVTKGASNNFYLDNIRIGEMGSLSMKSDENKAISYRLSVFPNPASTDAKILFDNEVERNIIIILTDVLGKTVSEIYANKLSEGFHEFDVNLSNFDKGLYFLTVSSNNQNLTTKKLIIK